MQKKADSFPSFFVQEGDFPNGKVEQGTTFAENVHKGLPMALQSIEAHPLCLEEESRMINFNKEELFSTFFEASGSPIKRVQQVRTDPVTLKKCRVTPSRALENERGTEKLYHPPEIDLDEKKCPFCSGNLESMTPCLMPAISGKKRLTHND